mmetsp:Transcript_94370/g.275951  ORF Transcript_94370/g.275951 Transcript_94370/m.275951 type:complete len:217 (-) Transcript_94370:200-850(-)
MRWSPSSCASALVSSVMPEASSRCRSHSLAADAGRHAGGPCLRQRTPPRKRPHGPQQRRTRRGGRKPELSPRSEETSSSWKRHVSQSSLRQTSQQPPCLGAGATAWQASQVVGVSPRSSRAASRRRRTSLTLPPSRASRSRSRQGASAHPSERRALLRRNSSVRSRQQQRSGGGPSSARAGGAATAGCTWPPSASARPERQTRQKSRTAQGFEKTR